MIDLFGKETEEQEAIHVNIYSDEVWETKHKVTGETWIYSVAIYERHDKPILKDIISTRYWKERVDWESHADKNGVDVHWADFGNEADKLNIINRWLKFINEDCFNDRKFYFSLIGINLSNLNRKEFGTQQNLNSIYNRFYKSMLQYSLKKFFRKGIIVENIYHEQGSQEDHKYFDWHTVLRLDEDEDLNFKCQKIEFLPKSHHNHTKANLLQLCDVMAGIFKDIHCGISESNRNGKKKDVLESEIVKELFVKRVIKNPGNKNSKYGYSNRFHLSFFPKSNSKENSIRRLMNNYYDTSKIVLAYDQDPNQLSLF